LNYVKTNGITFTSRYPYKAVDQTCKTKTGAFKISRVTTALGCTQIKAALMNQPVGVSVDASNWGSYKSGIFGSCSKSLNHNVLLVGLSSTFYLVKNSWGKGWG
jgi:C1A family cysteine protease